MIMTTFLESHDFTGKTVHPFVTYAVSGLGQTETVYSAALRDTRSSPASRCKAKRPATIALTSRLGLPSRA